MNIRVLFVLLFVGIRSVLFGQVENEQLEPRLVLPVGHTGFLQSATFSPDDNLVLTTDALTAIISDARSGKQIHVLKGHTDFIKNACFSPDNKFVLTASDDNTARIFDVLTGKELHVLRGHYSSGWKVMVSYDGEQLSPMMNLGLNSAEFSPKGDYVLSSGDTTVRIYKVSTGKQIKVLSQNTAILTASFSPNGKLVVTCNKDSVLSVIDWERTKTILKINLNTNKVKQAFYSQCGQYILVSNDSIVHIYDAQTGKRLMNFSEDKKKVISTLFSPDGRLILVASNDHHIRIYDLHSAKLLHNIYTEYDTLNSVVFSKDGKNVLTTSKNMTSSVYDVISGEQKQKFANHSSSVLSVCSNKEGNLILTREKNCSKIFEIESGQMLVELKGKSNYVNDLVFRLDDKSVLTAVDDKTARIFDINSGKELKSFKSENGTGHEVKISPDSQLALTFSPNGKIRIYDLNNGEFLHYLEGHTAPIRSASFSQNSRFVVTGSADKTARIYDVKSGKELQILTGHNWIVTCALFSPDNKMVLTLGMEKVARIFDVSSGRIVHILEGHESFINCGSFSPDGKYVLTAGNDSTARIFDVSTGNLIKEFKGHSGSISDCSFSPDGSMILTTSTDKTARVYDVTSEKQIHLIDNHKKWVHSGSFSKDGRYVLTASWDQTAQIYDLQSGRNIRILKAHENNVLNAVFSSDNKFVVTTSSDHKTILWDVESGKALYTRLQLEGDDWLVYDDYYRFDGTPGAMEQLYFVCGLEVVELNQVKDSLYVPNLVQRIMNGENLERLPKLSDLNICGVTPVVEPLEDGGKSRRYRITPRTGGLGDVEIYLNGVVRKKTKAEDLKQIDNEYIVEITAELLEKYQIPGEELNIKVIAKTANNAISSRGVILDLEANEAPSFRTPSLHAIVIGVDDYKGSSLDLNYAAKDANDLQRALEISAKKFFNIDDTNRVFFYNLTINRNGQNGSEGIRGITPDKGNILQTLDLIEKNSKPEDVLLVFFAGHGEIVEKDQLLLLTTESASDQLEGIKIRELLEKLNKIPAGKRVLILDACHSGAAINSLDMAQYTGKRDIEDAERKSKRIKELDKLASKSGLAIITASSSDQKALELPQYEHGLMTYALLSAMLNNKSAVDDDNNLQLEKWLMATEDEVKKLNNDQSAERFVPINFSIGKIDDEVRNSIVLKELPTVYVDIVFNLKLFPKDNLNLKEKLSEIFSEMSRGSDKKILIQDSPNANKISIKYEEKGSQIIFTIGITKGDSEQVYTMKCKMLDLDTFIQEIAESIRTRIEK